MQKCAVSPYGAETIMREFLTEFYSSCGCRSKGKLATVGAVNRCKICYMHVSILDAHNFLNDFVTALVAWFKEIMEGKKNKNKVVEVLCSIMLSLCLYLVELRLKNGWVSVGIEPRPSVNRAEALPSKLQPSYNNCLGRSEMPQTVRDSRGRDHATTVNLLFGIETRKYDGEFVSDEAGDELQVKCGRGFGSLTFGEGYKTTSAGN